MRIRKLGTVAVLERHGRCLWKTEDGESITLGHHLPHQVTNSVCLFTVDKPCRHCSMERHWSVRQREEWSKVLRRSCEIPEKRHFLMHDINIAFVQRLAS